MRIGVKETATSLTFVRLSEKSAVADYAKTAKEVLTDSARAVNQGLFLVHAVFENDGEV